MSKYLHYAGEDIRLPDDANIEEMRASINAAAGGSAWFEVEDARGAVHSLRVTPGVAVRLRDTSNVPPARPRRVIMA